MELTGGLTYSNARLNGPQIAPTGGVLELDLQSGDRLADVPEWQFNTGVTYHFPVFGSYEGLARFGWSYVGTSNTQLTDTLLGNLPNPNFLRKGSYSLANLRFGVSGDAWDASVFVNNLFENSGALAARVVDNEPLRKVIPQPRTIGVQFQYHYDGG